MKRLLLLVAILTVGCAKPEQPTVGTQINNPPPSTSTPGQTPAVQVYVTTKDFEGLRIQLTSIEDEIKKSRADLELELARERAKILDEVSANIKNTTALLATTQSVEAKLRDLQSRYDLRLAALDSRQQELSNQLGSVQVEIQRAQTEIQSSVDRLTNEVRNRDAQIQQNTSNSRFALAVLNEIADEKVGGVLGIGRKDLISDERQAEINNRISATPFVPEGIIIPSR